jgi:hypothetical protein
MQTHCQHGQSVVPEQAARPPPAPELEAALDVLPELDVTALVVPVVAAPPAPFVFSFVPLPRPAVLHAPPIGTNDVAPSNPRIRVASRRRNDVLFLILGPR